MHSQEDIKKIFGKVVMELRTLKGLTQEQLAEYLNLSPHTITRIETGNAFVSADVISQICKIFNVDPCVLFTSKPHILREKHFDYLKKINKILPSFDEDRLKEFYNILCVINK